MLVVANACWSSAAAQALGERLDFVIGHKLPVKDSDAIGFSKCLYQQIADGKTLQEAFTVAKMCSGGYELQGLADPSCMRFVARGNLDLNVTSTQAERVWSMRCGDGWCRLH